MQSLADKTLEFKKYFCSWYQNRRCQKEPPTTVLLVPFTTSYNGNTNNYKLYLFTSLTCDGRVAPGTLFSVQAAETLDAVRSLSLRGEGLTSQRSFAASAQKTLFVPHLVLVGHPSFSQWLWDTHQTILVISYQHQVLTFSSGYPVKDFCC